MSHLTWQAPRTNYRIPRQRYAWSFVSRPQALRALGCLEALCRKRGA